MGSYDYIQTPVTGQPISSSLYGQNVKTAINDLDRRLSAYDASTGIAKVSSTSTLVLATTAETAALTITGFTFRAGYAYKATIRMGISSAVAGTVCNCRLRKTNTVGLDWGEYFRFEGKGAAGVMSCLGTIYLLNSTASDVTADVVLSVASSVAAANAITIFANATSPRYFLIEPSGFAADYSGMGVVVS
jgi:hypothetical protein